MKTPEEIKKGLETCVSEDSSCADCPYAMEFRKDLYVCYGTKRAVIADAIAYIQQLEAQVPRWISVEDEKKPLHGHDYLCLCTLENDPHHEWDWQSVRLWYSGGSNGYVDRPHFTDEGVNGMRVTHWMQLPEPPKEDDHAAD